MNTLKVNDWRDIQKNYTGIAEYHNGDKEFYFNGQRHREDGPAVEFFNKDRCWFLDGELHRVDGPAVEYSNGDKEWFLYGVEYSQEEWFEQLTDEDKLYAVWNLR